MTKKGDKKVGVLIYIFVMLFKNMTVTTISVRVTRRHVRRAIVTLYETEIPSREARRKVGMQMVWLSWFLTVALYIACIVFETKWGEDE